MAPPSEERLYYEYFNERRFEEAGRLVHPEATFDYIPTEQHLAGRAGYRALVAAWVIAFEDATVEVTDMIQLDDRTVRADFIGRGTHTGDLVLGENFIIPASGVRSDLRFRDTFTFRDGLIAHARFEFDANELRR